MFYLILQIALNLLAAYGLYRINQIQKKSKTEVAPNWKSEWELEKKSLEEHFSVQLRSMKLLYEQTKKTLEAKEWELHQQLPLSLEETELRHVVSHQKPAPVVTLDQFEKEKMAFNAKCTLDLKTLLSNQLC